MAPVKSTRALLGQRPTVLLPPSNYVEPSEEVVVKRWLYLKHIRITGLFQWITDSIYIYYIYIWDSPIFIL